MSILKRKPFEFIIIFLIAFLNLFWLPTFSFWGIYPKNSFFSTNSDLIQYQHPAKLFLKLANKPQLSTQNYILLDAATNTIVLSNNPNAKIYPASTTKLITALTALNIYPLDEILTIKQEYTDGQVMGLKLGEKITIRSLVNALLVYSANDAAFTLANHHQNGEIGFVKEMNLIIQKYGLKNTNFTNFDGIHNENHYSTVYDLSQIARLAIKNSIVTETVKQKSITVEDVDKTIKHELTSTDELLGVIPEIEGLKTGWTPEAGGSFIALININGHYLISVVAQSEDRFSDTKKIIDWAKDNIFWQSYQP
ncbi:MAG: D-alanyl-D-alanine carboxypeptidase [Candidatus Shapirobacteria bacterium]|nr:D-alanyl-D-alanine carboxypeptidase [Candidatus Shapirobacteria bacterium]MDD4410650.1 D-alanyl-D-alanine carboxypeptidase [Candidatus Shapirobacteria bacterium]